MEEGNLTLAYPSVPHRLLRWRLPLVVHARQLTRFDPWAYGCLLLEAKKLTSFLRLWAVERTTAGIRGGMYSHVASCLAVLEVHPVLQAWPGPSCPSRTRTLIHTQGEDKPARGTLGSAKEDLLAKVQGWSSAYHGQVSLLVCFLLAQPPLLV